MVWHFPETDDEPDAVEEFVDSDWAGCLKNGKIYERWRVVESGDGHEVMQQHAGECGDVCGGD